MSRMKSNPYTFALIAVGAFSIALALIIVLLNGSGTPNAWGMVFAGWFGTVGPIFLAVGLHAKAVRWQEQPRTEGAASAVER